MKQLVDVIGEMLAAELVTVPVKFSDPPRTEKIIESRWEHAVLFAIVEAEAGADELVRRFLAQAPDRDGNRARVVFALRCLAEGAAVSRETAEVIFRLTIEHLEDFDGRGGAQDSCLDVVVRRVYRSGWGDACRSSFLSAGVRAEEGLRLKIVRILSSNNAFAVFGRETAEELMEDVLALLKRAEAGPAEERLAATLGLMERFRLFRVMQLGPRGRTLPMPQRSEAIRVLSAGAGDFLAEPTVALGAGWALLWLAEARSTNAQRDFVGPTEKKYQLTSEDDWTWTMRERLLWRALVADVRCDEALRRTAALLLSSRTEAKLVPEQYDWIYRLAVIADGEAPLRSLATPIPLNQRADEAALQALLSGTSNEYSRRYAAVSLGRLGCYEAKMAGPLLRMFRERDEPLYLYHEAVAYLIFLYQQLSRPKSGVVQILKSWLRAGSRAAEKAAVEEIRTFILEGACLEGDSPDIINYRDYCMFVILGIGDAEMLTAQLKKEAPNADAYALALAGLPRFAGVPILVELQKDHSPTIQRALQVARKKSAQWHLASADC